MNILIFSIMALMIPSLVSAEEIKVTGAEFKIARYVGGVSGTALIIPINTTVSKDVTLLKDQKYKISLQARGSQAFNIYPIFNLYLNDSLVGTYNTGKISSVFEATLQPNKESSVVKVQYINDGIDKAKKHDRNLVLESMTLDLIDKTPPTIKNLMTTKTVKKGSAVSVVYSLSDSESGVDLAKVTCELDSKLLSNCTSPISIGNLGIGDHSVKIIASDKSGNQSSSMIPFTVVAANDEVVVTGAGSVVKPSIAVVGEAVTADIALQANGDISSLVMVVKLKNTALNKVIASKTVKDLKFIKNQKIKISSFLTIPAGSAAGSHELEYGIFTPDFKKTYLYQVSASPLLVEQSKIKLEGQRLKLIGLNLSGGEYARGKVNAKFNFEYTYPTIKDIKYFVSAGMNIMRLPFDLNRVQKTRFGSLDAVELKRIEEVVELARQNNLQVILDPHNYGRMNDNSGKERVIGLDPLMPSENLSDFWKKFSAYFLSKTNVIFMIMNEPHDVAANIWKDVAVDSIQAIRETGSNHLILIPGVHWTGAHSWVSSGNGAAWAGFKDKNFAFEVHQYLDKYSSGTEKNCSVGSGSKRLVAFTNWARANKVKAILGEVGWASNTVCLKEGRDILLSMHNNPDVWLGYTYWAGGPWMSTYFQTIQPTNFGTAAEIEAPNLSIIKQFITLRP